jgi:uncharacterized protein (DUF362 family)
VILVTATVAVVAADAFATALDLIGGIEDLHTSVRRVVVKVGIFNVETGICTTVPTLQSIITAFDRAHEVRVVESDSFAGPGLARLELWRDCYGGRVAPFNLSADPETRSVRVAGELVPLSHVLFAPRTFISTHVPRRYAEAGDEDLMNLGFVLKNLLGLIPDTKKFRFHKQLPTALLDLYEAVGGIDLAVLDGTRAFLGWREKRVTVSPRVLVVGRDAFAVEAVGAHLVGFDPAEMPVLREARARGLGETDLDRIDIRGDVETPRRRILEVFRRLNPTTGRT